MKFQEVKVDGLAEEVERVAKGLQAAKDEKEVDELLANISQLQEHIVQLRSNSKDASERAMTEKCAEELALHFATCQSQKAAILAGEDIASSNVLIACRIRPSKNGAEPSVLPVSRSQVSVRSGVGRSSSKRKTYDFSEVFGPRSTKEDVFELVWPNIKQVLDGGNACVCAYGQTGSGKSYTLVGPQDGVEAGIFQLGLDAIFNAAKNEVEYKVEVQIFEVHNESMGDLLSGTGKKIMSGLEAERRVITSRDEGVQVWKEAVENKDKAVRSNGKKNRSHRIISVTVHGVNKSTGEKKSGCWQLVDLSGSERVGRTEATVERLEEAKHINRSMSVLGDVLGALSMNKGAPVPFDASPLTKAMEPSMLGTFAVVMIIHIAPEDCFRSESTTTIKFGQRVLHGEEMKDRVQGARDALHKMHLSDPMKEERELQMRIAARSAMSEKENMEKDLKALRDELNLTRRSIQVLDSRPFFRHSRTTSAINPDMVPMREREGSDSSSRTGRSSGGLRTSRSSSAVSRGAVSDSMQRLSRRPRGIDRPYASRGRRLSIAFEEPETPSSIKHRPAEVRCQ